VLARRRPRQLGGRPRRRPHLPGWAARGDDCDDSLADVNPDGVEVAGDGIDQDCDGLHLCFVDGDGDRVGTDSTAPSAEGACATPGLAPTSGDCDDTDPALRPGATDVPADGIDQDCDGNHTCWFDNDLDGVGGSGTVVVPFDDCIGAFASPTDGDCDDEDATTFPGADEVPGSGVDGDCDGWFPCFVDADGDGFGTGLATSADAACPSADGVTAQGGDCDDADPTTYPGAPDPAGDGIDQDCSGSFTCYVDADGDGFGDASGQTVAGADGSCSTPGVSPTADDCDDSDPDVRPNASDVPGSGVDGDCDGSFTCYRDVDRDGHGSTALVASADPACTDGGEAPAADDCDDSDMAVSPSAFEVPGDAVDDDCDGAWDCFEDADGDGFGAAGGLVVTSDDPVCTDAGEAEVDGDCDDAVATIFPGATEVPGNDLDEDCDGTWVCYADPDEDGWGADVTIPSADAACDAPGEAEMPGDCNDTDASINPDATERVGNTVDENCDGDWLCYEDADGDGVGVPTEITVQVDCTSDNASTRDDDCDDTDPIRSPTATDVPGNGLDEDCDGEDDPAEDTDVPIDTDDTDADTAEPPLDIEPDKGCGCRTGGAPAAWILLFPLLAVRRRR
jgi:hypothetical protein